MAPRIGLVFGELLRELGHDRFNRFQGRLLVLGDLLHDHIALSIAPVDVLDGNKATANALYLQHPVGHLAVNLASKSLPHGPVGQVENVVVRPVPAVFLVVLNEDVPGLAVAVELHFWEPPTGVHPEFQGLEGIEIAIDKESDHRSRVPFLHPHHIPFNVTLVEDPGQDCVLKLSQVRIDLTPTGQAVAVCLMRGGRDVPVRIAILVDFNGGRPLVPALAGTRAGNAWDRGPLIEGQLDRALGEDCERRLLVYGIFQPLDHVIDRLPVGTCEVQVLHQLLRHDHLGIGSLA